MEQVVVAASGVERCQFLNSFVKIVDGSLNEFFLSRSVMIPRLARHVVVSEQKRAFRFFPTQA